MFESVAKFGDQLTGGRAPAPCKSALLRVQWSPPLQGQGDRIGQKIRGFAQSSQRKKRAQRGFDLRIVAISANPGPRLLSRNDTLRPPFPLRPLRETAMSNMRFPCLEGEDFRCNRPNANARALPQSPLDRERATRLLKPNDST
jgi:hypothetical protein